MPIDDPAIGIKTRDIEEEALIDNRAYSMLNWELEHDVIRTFQNDERINLENAPNAPRRDYVDMASNFTDTIRGNQGQSFSTYLRYFLVFAGAAFFTLPRFMEEFLQEFKKKERKILLVEITKFPSELKQISNRGTVRTYYPLGGIAWKYQGAYYSPAWLYYERNIVVSPFPFLTDYDLLREQDAEYTVTVL